MGEGAKVARKCSEPVLLPSRHMCGLHIAQANPPLQLCYLQMQPCSRFLLALAFALSSCAASRELAVGEYVETRGQGVVMWTIRHFRILPGHTFQYELSTDDESGRYGAGSYTLRGNRLQLLCNGKAFVPASSAQQQALPTRPDSLLLTFKVFDGGDESYPEPFASIELRDKAGHVEKQIVSNYDGQAVVRTARSQHPHSMLIRQVGRQPFEQPWPDSSTAYKIFLQPSWGALYPAGSRLQFRVLEQTPTQLVVGRDKKSKVTFRFIP